MKEKIRKLLIVLIILVFIYFLVFVLPKLIEDISNFDKNNSNELVVLNSNYFSSYKGSVFIKLPIGKNAFSFGFIFLGRKNDNSLTVRHEYGHYLQLKELGLYKYIKYIAIPSLKGYWGGVGYYEYYSQPWEYGADLYGEVNRIDYPYSNDVLEKYNNYWNMIK